jgi:hypothetical protein
MPHAVPSGTPPATAQTGAPVPQASVPVLHESSGVQVVPSAQAMHVPPPQTRSVPQLVPFPTGAKVSTHSETPLVHDVAPTWHAFAGMQVAPETQAVHAPPLQT